MIKTAKNNIGKFQLLILTFVWVLIFTLPLLFTDLKSDFNWNHLYKIWSEYFLILIICLINRFVLLPNLFFKAKKLSYFASLLGVFVLFLGLVQINNLFGPSAYHNLQPLMDKHPDGFRPPMGFPRELIPPSANLLIIGLLMVGFDTGLTFSVKWMQSVQNQLKLEKENIESKMSFLQNQISPHFFMNTLNNIHALVDIDAENAKKSIIKLSQLMSYMLYESQTEKISIQKEMNFVESYVELMRLRCTDEIDIELNIPDKLPSVSIPPLLTISFIENAFKYGISYEKKSFIHINFEFTAQSMIFEINNTNHSKKETKANSGIGIKNTRNRLDLIYADRYKMEINELPENVFNVKLNIPL